MVKYKVLQSFRDLEMEKVHNVGDVIDISNERAKELITNLSEFEGTFIEKTTTKKKEVVE